LQSSCLVKHYSTNSVSYSSRWGGVRDLINLSKRHSTKRSRNVASSRSMWILEYQAR
jgi:hypothetical protein